MSHSQLGWDDALGQSGNQEPASGRRQPSIVSYDSFQIPPGSSLPNGTLDRNPGASRGAWNTNLAQPPWTYAGSHQGEPHPRQSTQAGQDDKASLPGCNNDAPTRHDHRGEQDHSGPFVHYEDVLCFEHGSAATAKEQFRVTERITRENTDTSLATSSGRRHSKKSYLSAWVNEIIWSFVSIICIVAIAALLHSYDNRSLPEWPLGITLNAVVAFLSTLCRAAFVIPVTEGLSQLKWTWFRLEQRPLGDFQAFDDASRGPFGSLKLLVKTGVRGRLLGVLSMLAALILLSSLVSASLTQSVIGYPTRYVASLGSTATVASSHMYAFRDVRFTATADLDMRQKQGIQQGIYNPANETFTALQPTCSSGQCGWEPFNSLAICVAINDVSDHLTVSDEMRADKAGVGLSILPPAAPLRNASLPNGVHLVGGTRTFNLNMSVSPFLSAANELELAADGLMETDTWKPASQSLSFKNDSILMQTAFSNFFLIYTNQNRAFEDDSKVFRAVEVLMHFCINKYEVRVENGTSHTDRTAAQTSVLTTNGTIEMLGNTLPNQIVLRAENDKTNYTIDPNYMRMLDNYATTTFAGVYSQDWGNLAPGYSATSDAFGTALYAHLHEDNDTGDADDTIRAAIGNITQNVATSLTNTIRALGTTEHGVVYVAETFVDVRWAWLAFLATQVGITLVFLIVVIVHTIALDVSVLKSSTLAVLFAINSEDKARVEKRSFGQNGGVSCINRESGNIVGHLGVTDRGWNLDIKGEDG